METPPPPEIPIIDVSPLYSGDADSLQLVASQIGDACRGIGFFYVKNHAVEDRLSKSAFQKAAGLFALETSKAGGSVHHSPHNRGYIGMGTEALDPSKPPDVKEAFNIGLDLAEDDPEV